MRSTRKQKPGQEGPIKIVVIEDNHDAAESLKMILELHGHEVRVAHSAMAGINLARAFLPEVILCDIGLQGVVDGFGVAQILRGFSEFHTTKIISVSGLSGPEYEAKARKAGFDSWVIKPYSLEELFGAINA